MSSDNVFAIPVFFVCFRECLETSIVISILLAFLKQSIGPEQDAQTYKKLVRQVWFGTGLGLLICLIIGGGMIGAFYRIGLDAYGQSEEIWEGVFSLIAAVIITIMGAALLRVSKMQEKWRVKLAKALAAPKGPKSGTRFQKFKLWCEKYALFLLPFVTVLREGLEAIVFIGGVGLGSPASSFPLAVICGLAAGALIGFFIYKGGNFASIQIFLIISTCFLYLIAAGLFSRGVWDFEQNTWNAITGGDAAETGDGAGSYDIRQSVWHVNCCNPEINGGGGWGIFNALLGWQNSATYGSVISYNLYWVVVILGFLALRFKETKGHWPLLKTKNVKDAADDNDSNREAKDVEEGAVTPDSEESPNNKATETSTQIEEVKSSSS